MAENYTKEDLAKRLFSTADKLRGNVDAAEYKHVVLGLIFLKYISDSFQEVFERLQNEEYADAEDRDEYLAENTFYVPPEARWLYIQAKAKDPNIGIMVDNAMLAIERENARLKGILPSNYGREALDKRRLGELIDLIGTITLVGHDDDLLGYVYEYFLGQFASLEGKQGGEFFTPTSIVELMVGMLEPYSGRVYDPCCGSGGMFVHSEKFVEAHGGQAFDISIYGQESNHTTYRLCRMNLEIRGIDSGQIVYGDTFHSDQFPDLRADYILANPPFNISDWGGNLLSEDARWHYGTPPTNNANYAWMQHIVSHLASDGRAAYVMSNGSMSTSTNIEADIRKAMVDGDLIDCMVALPPQLFHNTQIPACLWFINRAKPEHRRGQILFIDTRNMGEMIDRTRRELTPDDHQTITDTYHAWLNPNLSPSPSPSDGEGSQRPMYEDVAGFCASAEIETVQKHNYVLTPGRYVGAPELEDDGEPFPEKMERLTADLMGHFEESARLETQIRDNLRRLGYE